MTLSSAHWTPRLSSSRDEPLARPAADASPPLRMPPEWAPHERTLMSWPCYRALWGAAFAQSKDEYAQTARAIARFEPVTMVVAPGDERDASERCGPGVEIVAIPIDDSWIRDSGPVFVRDPRGARVGVTFRFDAYGGRFPHARDAALAGRVLAHLGIAAQKSEMVFEGGAVTIDGEGTLIATEQCLIHSQRNAGWSRGRIERELRARFGVRRIVWIPYGRAEDLHTDGHVDLVCAFVRPGVVVVQGCDDTTSPNHGRMRANLEVLRSATDANGRRLEIVELPTVPFVDCHGRGVMVSHANFYLCNGGLVLGLAGTPHDAIAIERLRRAMPERTIVGVPARAIALGGGGIHCITQQVPVEG